MALLKNEEGILRMLVAFLKIMCGAQTLGSTSDKTVIHLWHNIVFRFFTLLFLMYSQTLYFLFGLFIIVQNINFQMLTTYKMSIKTYNMHVHREQADLMFNDCSSIKWVDVYDTNSGSAREN